MEIGEIIAYSFMMVFIIGFFALLNAYLVALDTSAWSFTGSDFAIALLPVLPYLFLLTGIAYSIYKMLKRFQN